MGKSGRAAAAVRPDGRGLEFALDLVELTEQLQHALGARSSKASLGAPGDAACEQPGTCWAPFVELDPSYPALTPFIIERKKRHDGRRQENAARLHAGLQTGGRRTGEKGELTYGQAQFRYGIQGSWPFRRANCTRLITMVSRWPAAGAGASRTGGLRRSADPGRARAVGPVLRCVEGFGRGPRAKSESGRGYPVSPSTDRVQTSGPAQGVLGPAP